MENIRIPIMSGIHKTEVNKGQEGAGGINIKGNRGRWKNLIFGQ
jgi:hypothetical protein